MGSTASLPSQDKLRKIVWLRLYNANPDKLVEETLDDVFSAHDLDHDGKVGKEEFAQAAKKLGFEVGGDTDENSLKLDEMISNTAGLDGLIGAFDAMRAGTEARTVLLPHG